MQNTANRDPLYWISQRIFAPGFPPLADALDEPDGLLAVGGDLSAERLLCAYRAGIFPWFSDNQPVMWWSPDPRSVIEPQHFHVSRSLKRTLNQKTFRVSCDCDFAGVMAGCRAPRAEQAGTWITQDMVSAYQKLHELGIAHSVECWDHNELCGGVYGLAIGRVFFGESMFSARSNASKVALYYLSRMMLDWGYELLDCQVHNPHLETLGARCISRPDFAARLAQLIDAAPSAQAWNQANKYE